MPDTQLLQNGPRWLRSRAPEDHPEDRRTPGPTEWPFTEIRYSGYCNSSDSFQTPDESRCSAQDRYCSEEAMGCVSEEAEGGLRHPGSPRLR
jgi:hypothetical protein